MEVKQIYDIVNNATKEAIGDSVLLSEDLSNIVDVGEAILNARSLDKYVNALVDHIGKVIFVNRKYNGDAPKVLRDGWEYGAVLEKIASEMPEAVENESWELEDGASYDPNVFIRPKVNAKFFNKRTAFEIDRSITDRQARSGFSGAEQLAAFISMLFNEVDKSATVKTSEIVRRCINNFTAQTIADYLNTPDAAYSGAGNNRCVNLLSRYNTQYSKSLTAANCIYDPEFIRYAAYIMGIYRSRMRTMSKLFNMGGMARFTPSEYLHFVLLGDFKAAADVFLQSETFHNSFVKLPESETVSYWQGEGESYSFSDISAIKCVTASGASVDAGGILGVMFDHDALGVCNPDRRVTTNYNPKAEFTNYFYKFDAQYFNDFNENFVVFYVANAA